MSEPSIPPRVLAGIATVRLQVEGLKHTVMHCLDAMATDMQATIRHYTEEAVREFNFPEQVAREARAAIADTLRHLVKNAVQAALHESEPLRRIIEAAVSRAVEEEMRR